MTTNTNSYALGNTVYWSGRPMKVTRVGLPGEYGPRIELDGKVITTPGLDHYLKPTADAPDPPSLYSLMWGGR